MNKYFYVFTLLLLITSYYAKATDINRLRQLMGSAQNSEDSAKTLYSLTEHYTESSAAIDVAFKALGTLMMCNHLGNPLSKLSYFNNGKSLLEKAVKLDANNIEIRFMRFCTQTNSPKFLNYYGSIDEDKVKLISYLQKNKNINTKDEDLFRNIKSYLLNSTFCSDSEKKIIKNL